MTWTKSYFDKKPPQNHAINDFMTYSDDVTNEYWQWNSDEMNSDHREDAPHFIILMGSINYSAL